MLIRISTPGDPDFGRISGSYDYWVMWTFIASSQVFYLTDIANHIFQPQSRQQAKDMKLLSNAGANFFHGFAYGSSLYSVLHSTSLAVIVHASLVLLGMVNISIAVANRTVLRDRPLSEKILLPILICTVGGALLIFALTIYSIPEISFGEFNFLGNQITALLAFFVAFNGVNEFYLKMPERMFSKHRWASYFNSHTISHFFNGLTIYLLTWVVLWFIVYKETGETDATI